MSFNSDRSTANLYAQGQMAKLTKAFDWEKTSLGPINSWPAPLLVMVNQILDSSFPMFIWWGEEMLQFYNDAYLRILGEGENSKHPQALGQKGQDCWPEIWPIINPLLQQVLQTSRPIYLEDQLIPIYRHGRLDDIYWTFSYNLIRDIDGSASGILVVCSETTDKIKHGQDIATVNEELTSSNEELFAINEELSESQKELQDLNEDLENRVTTRTEALGKAEQIAQSERKRLAAVISQVPAGLALLSGKDMVLESANTYMLDLWDKDRNAIGRPLLDFLPELRDQPFPVILDEVYTTGKPYFSKDAAVKLIRGGKPEQVYMDFSYTPLKDKSDLPNGILVLAEDVTERTISRQREQQLTEELAASNEELASSNEILITTIDELADAQQKHTVTINHLKESEGRFQTLIREATTGIIVLRGDDMRVDIVNDGYARLIGRTVQELLNRPLFDVIPEAEANFRSIIAEVFESNKPILLYDYPYTVNSNGKEIHGYLNLAYQPYKELDGTIAGVMVLCQDVTDQVEARRKAREAEERANLAMAAAKLGTFDLNFDTQEFIASARLDEILGIIPPAPYAAYFSVFHPEDVPIREQAHLESLETGKLHYKARILKRQEISWVQAEGQVFFDQSGKPLRLVGSMQDITAEKLAQQQKDDFISIASHELKTPITSLKASLQLMDKMKSNMSSEMLAKLIFQSRKSVEKVGVLVEDLLNVSRLQQGQLSLQKSSFIISELLNTIANPIHISGKHQIEISGDLELKVYADENRIDQVITNLLNNAVKYAPDSKKIIFELEKTSEHARVSITDQGPGIPADKIPHLFDRFFRVDQSGYQASGFGLGLYISSEIVKRHSGEIGVISHQGEGSTFWFTLPLL